MAFRFPVSPRYLEVDGQGVVFHMWYLAYFDDALPAYLADGGWPYADMMAAGYDLMLVRTEIEWRRGLAWLDRADVLVSTATVGRTSFGLDFVVEHGGAVVCTARTVYVVVGTDGSGKRDIPARLRAALGKPSAAGPA